MCLEGKHLQLSQTPVAIKLDVLTLSGLQQIELNRFDAATRGVIWEEQAPNKDQRKVVNQYLKFLSKMWEHAKMEATKSGGPMPTILTKDPCRQTGQHPQNLIPIQPVPILPKNMPMPQVGPSRPNHQMPSAPIPIPGSVNVPLAVLTPVESLKGQTPPPSYQATIQASVLEAALKSTSQRALPPAPTPEETGSAARHLPLKKLLKRRFQHEGKLLEE